MIVKQTTCTFKKVRVVCFFIVPICIAGQVLPKQIVKRRSATLLQFVNLHFSLYLAPPTKNADLKKV